MRATFRVDVPEFALAPERVYHGPVIHEVDFTGHNPMLPLDEHGSSPLVSRPPPHTFHLSSDVHRTSIVSVVLSLGLQRTSGPGRRAR